MKGGGIFFWVVGAVLLGTAIFMDTTAPNSEILNLGALQNQLMLWQGGLALVIGGCVLFAVGSLSNNLERLANFGAGVLELDHDRTEVSEEESQEVLRGRMDALDNETLPVIAGAIGIVILIVVCIYIIV